MMYCFNFCTYHFFIVVYRLCDTDCPICLEELTHPVRVCMKGHYEDAMCVLNQVHSKMYCLVWEQGIPNWSKSVPDVEIMCSLCRHDSKTKLSVLQQVIIILHVCK
jgi:hypothetical protein